MLGTAVYLGHNVYIIEILRFQGFISYMICYEGPRWVNRSELTNIKLYTLMKGAA
jgi:hypothetical protein